ncbi:MAG: MipA/OmpV family protein [Ramlibacter sp.]|nr:MipA/OmpV family protein [Ramlibacter sp.]
MITGFACAAILPLAAFAELSNDSMVGLGLRSRPAYDGSDSQKTELVPVVRYLGHPWFVRSTQGVLEGGVRTELLPGLHAGAQLAYEAGRRAGDSGFLAARNVADIKRGASVGLQLEWDHKLGPVPLTLLGRVRRNIDSDLGTQADLRLSAGVFQSGRFGAGVFAQAVWADAKSTRSNYGITPAQSIATTLPVYQPTSGWLNTSAGLLWSFDLGPKWIAVGTLERRWLSDDAAASPLAERRSNSYVAAGLAYRF